ncbi:hypothetical protein ACFSR9_07860 [Deinococcus taklimakanensis]|uniref:Outer membrane protein beta-barrel domain-containing protein n=1 Tax=Deinococcus taklimakanensis TaxID=536443 RepID=A0ABW5P3A9_9DEIO
MKKALLSVAALAAVSSASAANYIGGFVGTDAGLHYQQDISSTSAMRYAITGLGLFSGAVSIGGEVAYLNDATTGNTGGLDPYYGFGLGAGVGIGNGAAGVSLYPHVLGGLKYNLGATSPLTVFGELNAGPAIAFATTGSNSAAGVGFGWGARIGLNYRLN